MYALAIFSKSTKILISATIHELFFIMTLAIIDDHIFKEKLLISRNKAKLLLNFFLNSAVNSILETENLSLPILTRSGNLEYSKDPEKFGKIQKSIFIFINVFF